MNNTTGSVWQPVAVTATGLTTVTGNVFVAKTPEVFSYDLDGNMTSDGRWNYTWDAENRLIKVESRSDTPSSSWRRIEWTYDAFGRRIQQVTSIWTNNAWFVVENLKFVSDPMLFGRHIVELNGTNNTLVRSYVWGLDLSGTMDGDGGVGGLAWVTLHTASGAAAGTHFAAYDGNGNVVGLVSATTGTETARYEYGPFGEPVRVSGPAAALNPFRFSTKRIDPTTDLVLYEYRAYSLTLGQWLSHDPVKELGFRRTFLRKRLKAGHHTYAFVGNNPVNRHDVDGLGVACAIKWALQVELGHAGPINCAGSAITDAFVLLKLFYPSYNPKSNGHNALHCLANCFMAKYYQFPGKTDEEIYQHLMAANIEYEFCTMKEELCWKWCGDVDAYKRDYESDIKADIVGIWAGLSGKDCVSACEPETRTPGPKQPDSCDCKVAKECEEKYFDKYGNLKPDTRPF